MHFKGSASLYDPETGETYPRRHVHRSTDSAIRSRRMGQMERGDNSDAASRRERMNVRLMDVVATIGAVAALLAAVFGYINGVEIAELRGQLDSLQDVISEHVSSPGLHR